jgi:hypothetical protein
MQQALKPVAGIARAQVVAPQLFAKLFSASHDAVGAHDPGFGRETFAAFTRLFETGFLRNVCA